MRLTDTQLVLLSAASQPEDGAVFLTPNLKGNAATKVVSKLLSEKLIEEISANGSLPVWRRDDDAGPLALRITKRGVAAIGVAGGRSQGVEQARLAEQAAERSPQRPVSHRVKMKDQAPKQPAKAGRSQSKQARVLAMLQREQGATVAAVMTATGWQHSAASRQRWAFSAAMRDDCASLLAIPSLLAVDAAAGRGDGSPSNANQVDVFADAKTRSLTSSSNGERSLW